MTRTWTKREDYEPDITIVTTLFDGRNTSVPHTVGVYTTDWVDKLYRGIARNYSGKFDFICLGDQNYKFQEPIKSVRLSESVDEYGWMCMVDMYRPDLCTGRRFTAGLDTIITGPLDDILNHKTKIGLCSDPITPELVCNAVTLASPGFCEEMWKMYQWKKKDWLRECLLSLEVKDTNKVVKVPSEMDVLRRYYNDAERLDQTFPLKILSYKMSVQHERRLIETASIVYFHGVPKPHRLNEKWIEVHWR